MRDNKKENTRNKSLIYAGVFLICASFGAIFIGSNQFLYESTGSSSVYSKVFLIQLLVQCVVNFLAGVIIDVWSSKKLLVLANFLAGSCVCLGSLAIKLGAAPILSSLVIMLSQASLWPLVQSCLFGYVGRNFHRDEFVSYFSGQTISSLSGQILGVSLMGVLIPRYPIPFLLGGAGGAILVSFMIFLFLESDSEQRTQSRISTKTHVFKTIQVMSKSKKIAPLILWAAMPSVFINLFNVSLAPAVEVFAKGDERFLSWFDLALVIGSIAGASMIKKFQNNKKKLNAPIWHLAGLSVFIFLYLMFQRYLPFPTSYLIAFFWLGSLCSIWSIGMSEQLQLKTKKESKGAVSSLQHITTLLLSATVIPLFQLCFNGEVIFTWIFTLILSSLLFAILWLLRVASPSTILTIRNNLEAEYEHDDRTN